METESAQVTAAGLTQRRAFYAACPLLYICSHLLAPTPAAASESTLTVVLRKPPVAARRILTSDSIARNLAMQPAGATSKNTVTKREFRRRAGHNVEGASLIDIGEALGLMKIPGVAYQAGSSTPHGGGPFGVLRIDMRRGHGPATLRQLVALMPKEVEVPGVHLEQSGHKAPAIPFDELRLDEGLPQGNFPRTGAWIARNRTRAEEEDAFFKPGTLKVVIDGLQEVQEGMQEGTGSVP